MNGQNDDGRPQGPPGRRDEDEANARESRAILERVARETEPQIGAGTERLIRGAGGHLLARDQDPEDRIEVWGSRIGRGLGLVAFAVLAVWLVQALVAS